MSTPIVLQARGRPCRGLRPGFALALLLGLALALPACGGGSSGGGETGGTQVAIFGTTVALTEPIAPGDVCAAGGYSIDYGIDANGNGELDADEVAGTAILCNGAAGLPGDDATSVLYTFTPAPGPVQSCGTAGGTRIDMGFDDGRNGGTAGDGILQTGEIRQTHWICAYGTGVSQGTSGLPMVLTPWSTKHTAVAAGGVSFYGFTAPQAARYHIKLWNTDSDLRWVLYSDLFATTVATCDTLTGRDGDEACLTPSLTAGKLYYLKVEERSNIPDLFDVRVSYDMLVGASSTGTLYRIDPADGALTLLYDTGLGNLAALAYSHADNVIYVATDSTAQCVNCIYALDPVTGSARLVVGPATPYPESPGYNKPPVSMAVRPWDGVPLGVMDEVECAFVYQVDPVTGEIMEIAGRGAMDCSGAGYGMTFDDTGALLMAHYSNATQEYYRLSLEGNAHSLLTGTVTYSGYPATPGKVVDMATRPVDGKVFTLTADGYLGSLNPVTQVMTYIATPAQGEVPPPPAPLVAPATRQTVMGVSLKGITVLSRLGKPPYTYPAVREFTVADGGNANAALSWRDYPLADYMVVYWSLTSGIDPANPATYDGIVTVPRVDDSATVDVYDNINPSGTEHFYRIVPIIGGKAGTPSAEKSCTVSSV